MSKVSLLDYIETEDLSFEEIKSAIVLALKANKVPEEFVATTGNRLDRLIPYIAHRASGISIDLVTLDQLKEIQVKLLFSNLSFWLDGLTIALYTAQLIKIEECNNINSWIETYLPRKVEH
jgi:hypothetical protein